MLPQAKVCLVRKALKFRIESRELSIHYNSKLSALNF